MKSKEGCWGIESFSTILRKTKFKELSPHL